VFCGAHSNWRARAEVLFGRCSCLSLLGVAHRRRSEKAKAGIVRPDLDFCWILKIQHPFSLARAGMLHVSFTPDLLPSKVLHEQETPARELFALGSLPTEFLE
jgi:hypothetical protein